MMSNLPTGTVTFLFTDIVGSTRLWEAAPRAMQQALAVHDEILHGTIASAGGVVFKTVGDAFCASFQTSAEAVDAAIQAQLKLREAIWPVETDIAVRMAIHTGAAVCRENDYFGPPLNRIARLLATAHGGQIVLSDVAHDLVRDSLPSDITSRSLGEHRLRDLWRPECVFQICHPSLEGSFPPLKSLNNPELPNNLPEQLTNFVGREHELALIGAFIEKSRLVTLTGSGGCGKTRLALQVAADVLEDFPDGVWLVEFAGVREASLVPSVVSSTLGVREVQGQEVERTITNDLRQKRMLLVLDNCEHLVEACANFASRLLKSCPGVRVFATSREHLGIEGELTFRVPSLSLPEIGGIETPDSLSQYEAVRLFIERAVLHDPAFTVTNANAPAVASICRRLDGIALALELAAAKVPLLSVEDINDRLGERFGLFASGSRTALPRQQTLRAMIDWSFDLLAPNEQLLFERLAVFEGGWNLDEAEKICACAQLGSGRILNAHAQLLAKSMIQVVEGRAGRRYRLLETVRHYSLELAKQSEVLEGLLDQHLDYFVTWAGVREAELIGSSQIDALQHLDCDVDNVRAALSRGLETRPERAARIAASLWRYWEIRGMLQEGAHWLDQALAAPFEDSTLHGDVLNGAGNLAFRQGRFEEAERFHQLALELRRPLMDERRLAVTLNNLGLVYASTHKLEQARPLFEESLGLREKSGDRRGVAVALFNLALLARELNDLVGAKDRLNESCEAFRALGDVRGVAAVQSSLGWVEIDLGNAVAANAALIRSAAAFSELGDTAGETGVLIRQSQAARMTRNLDEAARCLRRAHEIGVIPENRSNTIAWLRQACALFCASGDIELAIELVGTLFEAEARSPGLSPRDMRELEVVRDTCLSELGSQRVAESLAKGSVQTLHQAVSRSLTALRSHAQD